MVCPLARGTKGDETLNCSVRGAQGKVWVAMTHLIKMVYVCEYLCVFVYISSTETLSV